VRIAPDGKRVLRECLAERQRSQGRARDASFVDSDLAFHGDVIAAAHSPLLAEMFDSFGTVLREALTSAGRGDAAPVLRSDPAS
jgi:DNA-binding FadR family transcriptional regulator